MSDEKKELKVIIAPSLLSCDFANLAAESQRMVDIGADWLHCDVMDYQFVPNLTFGAPILKCLRKHTDAFLDCHLMVVEPERMVDEFCAAGANQITFHIEATSDAAALAKSIRSKGMRAGVSLKPGTAVETVFAVCDAGAVDLVLVMTVEPGFGGQSFMSDMMEKVAVLRKRYPTLDIQVDGGVNCDTIAACATAGANVAVSGSGVFKAPVPKEAIETMRQALTKALAAEK